MNWRDIVDFFRNPRLWMDRQLSKSLFRQLGLLAVGLGLCWGLSFGLLNSCEKDWQAYCEERHIRKEWFPLYLLIDSNAFNGIYATNFTEKNNKITEVGGDMLILSGIIYVVGLLIINGAVIGIITNSIEQRVRKHRKGHLHYLRKGHYVVLGWDDMVPSIISHILDKDHSAYVLLMSAADAELIRERLLKTFNAKQLKRIILNFGHRTSKDYYKAIHLESAREIYIVGKRSMPSHDAINVECVDSICSYLNELEDKRKDKEDKSTENELEDKRKGKEDKKTPKVPKRILCVFEDLDTYGAFKTSEIFGKVEKLNIEFIPYNFYAGWAKQVFIKGYYRIDNDRADNRHDRTDNDHADYPKLYSNRSAEADKSVLTVDDPRYVHTVFVGTTNFAVAFAMEAAQVLHLPNGSRRKTRITFIDKNADVEKEEFITRNRHFFEVQQYHYYDLTNTREDNKEPQGVRTERLYFTKERGYKETDANFLDVEFEFIKGDILSKPVQDLLTEWAKDVDGQYLSIFMALSNSRQNFVISMNMPEEVYYNEIPVFIRQDRTDRFISDLREADMKIRDEEGQNVVSYVSNGQLIERTKRAGKYAHLYPFGMYETAYSADEESLERAKLINYLYCTMPGNHFQSLSDLEKKGYQEIRQKANESWKKLTVALKWSNLYNAYNMRIKLDVLSIMRSGKFYNPSEFISQLSDEEAEILARVEHNRWNVEKLLMGYRKAHHDEDKYTEENRAFAQQLKRNKKRYIHHDIRRFEDLDDIRELDFEFARYIPWIINPASQFDK